jgi:hypothetical protein
MGKATGKALTEYASELEAQEGADYASSNYGRYMVPYKCDKCQQWHIAPESRQTPSNKCPRCVGTDGIAKESYRSEREAKRRANILRKEQGAELGVYVCEHGNGWHLTKKGARR